MLYTTFKLARDAYACTTSYRQFARHVGGVRKYGPDSPIPLTDILEVCGLYDALWALRCTTEPELVEILSRHLAADFAEHVLHIFEDKYPGDDSPRKAIQAARLYADGDITAAAWDAAGAAAWAAAGDAAGAAARDAAWAAARAAAWAAATAAAGDAAGDAAGAAARAAAWAAAWDAATAAARAAAGAAAEAAEREWQTKRFLEVLRDTPEV